MYQPIRLGGYFGLKDDLNTQFQLLEIYTNIIKRSFVLIFPAILTTDQKRPGEIQTPNERPHWLVRWPGLYLPFYGLRFGEFVARREFANRRRSGRSCRVTLRVVTPPLRSTFSQTSERLPQRLFERFSTGYGRVTSPSEI